MALLVGANKGWAQDSKLQYADNDVSQFEGVLKELGGIPSQNIVTLKEPSVQKLRSELEAMKKKLAGAAKEKSYFLFYYSGHADAKHLHLEGEPPFSLEELHGLLRAMPATVKVGILDACNSGAILNFKGATSTTVPFDVKVEDDLSVSGTVIFTSSGAAELSLEASALSGSLFTHHFVSGLRGVADKNEDNGVSIEEAYDYAYGRTQADTTDMPAGLQKPRWRIDDLKGQGNLYLTQLNHRGGRLKFPPNKQPCFVIDKQKRKLVAEVTAGDGKPAVLAVPEGSYEIMCREDAHYRVAFVQLKKGDLRDTSTLSYRNVPLSEGGPKKGTPRRPEAAEISEALGKKLTAAAAQLRKQHPEQLELRTLLAVEALRNHASVEAHQELRQALERLPRSGVCMEHPSPVLSVAWRPDGRQLVTGSVDKLARIWDAETGAMVTSLPHGQPVTEVAWGQDGLLLSTQQGQEEAFLWEFNRGKNPLYKFREPTVRTISFEPTGRYLAFVDYKGELSLLQRSDAAILLTVPGVGPLVRFSVDGRFLVNLDPLTGHARVWDVATLKQVFAVKLKEFLAPPDVLAISEDGSFLAFASKGARLVQVWDVEGGRQLSQFSHEANVKALAFASDGTLLTASEDKTVRRWKPVNGDERMRMTHEERLESMALSPDGQQLATTWQGGHATSVRSLQTGQEVMRLNHRESVNAVAWSPDGNQLATASGDGAVCIWGAAGDAVARGQAWGRHSDMAFSRDSHTLVTMTEDEQVRAWETTTLRERAQLPPMSGASAKALGRHGKLLALAQDASVHVWDVASEKQLANLKQDGPTRVLAFSPDETLLAGASRDGTVRVWEAATGREQVRVVHAGTVWSVAISPDGKRLATGGSDLKVRLWDLPSGKELSILDHKLLACVETPEAGTFGCGRARLVGVESVPELLVFSGDGRYLATATQDAVVRVWNIELGRERLLRHHQDLIRTLAFSADGGDLAIATGVPEARVWGVETGQEKVHLMAESGITSLQYSEEGHHLIAATREKGWRLWEANSGREVARGQEETPLEGVLLSPDGRFVVTGYEDDSGRLVYSVMAWRPEDLAHQACARLRRNMTPQEWNQFLSGMESQQKTCAALP
ncbi:caspase family protein [Hyalangium rubrum]|uniref:Caspase family protein n=1 Tax=Hyalangium rubrum TaxID=3103134 RepID=A0ABU5HG49_9BACT|nr:caspase family protein [Hyalangium sp. s54d21]MDY7231824.1 caspase family protein [Hyalangium sp. s54d21]